MITFRLAKERYKNSLSGIGAARYGGRWNGTGIEIIYTASSRALAMAEMLVHLDMNEVPDDFHMMSILIPDDIKIKSVSVEELPSQWNRLIEYLPVTKLIGNTFIQENEYCLLQVPSAVVKGDFNILINPYHKSFREIEISEVEIFPFDRRLFE